MICFDVWQVLTVGTVGIGVVFGVFWAGHASETRRRRRRHWATRVKL